MSYENAVYKLFYIPDTPDANDPETWVTSTVPGDRSDAMREFRQTAETGKYLTVKLIRSPLDTAQQAKTIRIWTKEEGYLSA